MSIWFYDASTWVRLHSSLCTTLDSLFDYLFPQRSPPALLIPAARGSLKPASDSRLRWAYHHLPMSLYTNTALLPVLLTCVPTAHFQQNLPFSAVEIISSSVRSGSWGADHFLRLNGSKGQILLKNSVKMEGCFSAEKQSILNFSQHWLCELTSCFVERDR